MKTSKLLLFLWQTACVGLMVLMVTEYFIYCLSEPTGSKVEAMSMDTTQFESLQICTDRLRRKGSYKEAETLKQQAGQDGLLAMDYLNQKQLHNLTAEQLRQAEDTAKKTGFLRSEEAFLKAVQPWFVQYYSDGAKDVLAFPGVGLQRHCSNLGFIIPTDAESGLRDPSSTRKLVTMKQPIRRDHPPAKIRPRFGLYSVPSFQSQRVTDLLSGGPMYENKHTEFEVEYSVAATKYKYLNTRKQPCVQFGEKYRLPVGYTASQCQNVCGAEARANLSGCVKVWDFFLGLHTDLPLCREENYGPEVRDEDKEKAMKNKCSVKRKCHKQRACEEWRIQFEEFIPMKLKTPWTGEQVEGNMTGSITVHFAPEMEQTVQFHVMSIETALGGIGGLMGMWTGFAFISLWEYFLLLRELKAWVNGAEGAKDD